MKFNDKGYTLIEILTVTALLVVITTIIAGIVYTTLRATNKTKITSAIAQNGSYAMSVISNIIISSSDVTYVNGIQTIDIKCTAPLSGSSITFTRNDGGTTELACRTVNGVYTIASNGASLIDNSIVAVENGSCNFTCTQPSNNNYATPIINVQFTLTDTGTKAAFENLGTSDFTTSVTMRSFGP